MFNAYEVNDCDWYAAEAFEAGQHLTGTGTERQRHVLDWSAAMGETETHYGPILNAEIVGAISPDDAMSCLGGF